MLYEATSVKQELPERALAGLHGALIRHLPTDDKGTSVLDIGCGSGAWLERLAELGFRQLHGIDLDVSQFRAKRATCLEVNLDSERLELGEMTFGLITAIELIEHLENPGRLFNLVSTCLSNDGYFLLTTPNIHSLQCRLKFFLTGDLASFDKKGDPTHVYPVLLPSLQKILQRYSLGIVGSWGYPEAGSLIYRLPIRLMSAGLGLVLPNQIPGDTLCLLIKRVVPIFD